jgi:hypothetical protein
MRVACPFLYRLLAIFLSAVFRSGGNQDRHGRFLGRGRGASSLSVTGLAGNAAVCSSPFPVADAADTLQQFREKFGANLAEGARMI